jgi:hypothetical protein
MTRCLHPSSISTCHKIAPTLHAKRNRTKVKEYESTYTIYNILYNVYIQTPIYTLQIKNEAVSVKRGRLTVGGCLVAAHTPPEQLQKPNKNNQDKCPISVTENSCVFRRSVSSQGRGLLMSIIAKVRKTNDL